MVRKPGFAPEPSASRAEMLLLHHSPDGASGRTCAECLRTATMRVYETRPVAAEAGEYLRFAIYDLRAAGRQGLMFRSARKSQIINRKSKLALSHGLAP